MSKLVIVESPGKIKKIKEYLGSDYIVSASVGHIMDLNSKTLSVDLDTFEPQYVVYDDKINVVKDLKYAVTKVGKNNVYLGADEDREGEMIAWSLSQELKLTKINRIVFNSITKSELTKAVNNPKNIDMPMVYAQQTRRILDRFAGYLISPLLNSAGYKGMQSAGRVQSVVVKIIVDKEREIEDFFKKKTQTYFYITDLIQITSDINVLTKLVKKDSLIDFSSTNKDDDDDVDQDNDDDDNNKKNKGKKKEPIKNKESSTYEKFPKSEEDKVIKLVKALVKGEYIVLDIKEKIKKSNAPAPFTTSTLQQFASSYLKMNGKRTMSVAQKLYEQGHITYMRTDSTNISKEAIEAIKNVIKDKYKLSYFEEHQFVNKKGNTQEAHECIRPTKPEKMASDLELSSDEKRLYEAIWKRTIQSQMKAAEYQNIIIEIDVKDKKSILEPYKLVGQLDNLIYEGYLIVDNKKGNNSIDIEKLKKSKKLKWLKINAIEDTNKPPSRFNQASLIRIMDPKNLNIGRPSTYANIIDKIISRQYIEEKDVDGKELTTLTYSVNHEKPKEITQDTKTICLGKAKQVYVPTDLGIKVCDFLVKYFSLMMDYKFTSNMEKELDEIANNKLKKLDVIKKFYEYINDSILKSGIKIMGPIKNTDNILGNHNGVDILLCDGKFGKFIVYNNNKFNLDKLIKTYNIDDDSSNKKIVKAVIKEIENPIMINNTNNNTNNNCIKEWTIRKEPCKLLKGKFGYYINYKNMNYTMNFIIDKIAKEHNIQDDKVNDKINIIADAITMNDIKEQMKYKKEQIKKDSKESKDSKDSKKSTSKKAKTK